MNSRTIDWADSTTSVLNLDIAELRPGGSGQSHMPSDRDGNNQKTSGNANERKTLEIGEKDAQEADQTPSSGTTVSSREWKAGKKEWMVIIVHTIVSLMVALDATILVTALPALARDLHGNATNTFWTGTSYLLTQAVFQPLIVSLSDVFGRRLFYLVSLAFFTIGTLLCCLSQNFNELLAGRSIQGIGGGGLLALGMVIVTDIIPLRQRPVFIGVIQISWAIGTVSGPLLGGLFVQHTTWRWIFYINFPFCAFGFLTVPMVMRFEAKRASLKERLLYVDWVGGFLFVASTCSFLIGVTWGGSEYPWTSWRTLVPIFIGFAGVVVTIGWERLGAFRPFLRLELFNSYSALAAYIGAALQGLLMFCLLYYVPFYLESVKDFSPTITGLALMPCTGALILVSVIVGRLITRFGRYQWAIWLGWAITITGNGLYILLDVDIRVYALELAFVVVGIGHGLILISLTCSVQAMADSRNVAYAVAMFAFVRTFGMCIGVAIGGAIFQNELEKHLVDLHLPAGVSDDAENFVSTRLKALPKDSAEYHAYTMAYADSFKVLFGILTGIAGLTGILSLLIKEYTMDKDLDSEHVLRRAKEESSPEAN